MKIDYSKTIDGLKESGLIQNGDKCAVALFKPETTSNGITSTTITSKVDYVMSANDSEIRLFDIDKKTGEYLDSYLIFKKETMVFAKKFKERNFIWASKGLFGGINIALHFIAEGFVHDYVVPKTIHGYEQKEARLELFAFIKDVYNAHYNALEYQYKNK